MKPEIKLQTAQGDRTFPLVRQDIKTGGIEEGALVRAKLNEAGAVIEAVVVLRTLLLFVITY